MECMHNENGRRWFHDWCLMSWRLPGIIFVVVTTLPFLVFLSVVQCPALAWWEKESFLETTSSIFQQELILPSFVSVSQHSDVPTHSVPDYNNRHDDDNSNSSRVLNVHIVPHTHDDVGWLKTVSQYFFGWNNSIQHASVHDIIDTVVASLQENPKRKFTYVEQKFFSMWWERQNDATKESVRLLVENDQLNFVNGGWCMHDEAATHYMGMIDQTTLGHSFLKKELGVIPKIGWQLDPFGHSATQASMMTSKMGFDALYFGRIDYQDLRLRRLEQECEGLWNASTSLHDTTIFWGLTGSYKGNYGPPTGFCFEAYCPGQQLINMNSTTLMKTMKDFLREIRMQSDETKGSHIMLTMGSDFQYEHARVNFANLDALIETVTDFQQWHRIDIPAMLGPRFDKINIFYSTPEIYTKSKYDELRRNNYGIHLRHNKTRNSSVKSFKYSMKNDDFFPYSDCEHCFWTGYFTSRATLKKLERISSSFLFAARQVESTLDVTGHPDAVKCDEPMHALEDASGVAQHHDGVSGTSKQHVANDYAKRLQAGIDGVSNCMIRKVKRLLLGANASEHLTDLSYCQLLNETVCGVSQKATMSRNGVSVFVIVYNSLSHERSLIIDLPVSLDGVYDVERVAIGGGGGAAKREIKSHPSSPAVNNRSASFVVSFSAGPLPSLGACLYKVSFSGKSTSIEETQTNSLGRHLDTDKLPGKGGSKDVEASNGLFSVVFDGTTGSIKKMKTGGTEIKLRQTWGYYTSFNSKDDSLDPKKDHQNSGAYIFRPSTPDQELYQLKAVSATFVNTSVGIEVNVLYNESWIQSKTRVLEGQPHLEVEYTVGPIPIDDKRGKEIVTRFESSIASSSTFYTDSNGREFVKRVRNYRPTWNLTTYEPVAGNYYPVNAAIYIEDTEGQALTVATDRSQGGSSLMDGSIELMVHRRTIKDDARGVGEPMNETDGGITANPPFGNATRIGAGIVVRGTHRLLIGGDGGAKLARSMMDSMYAEPVVLVGSSPRGIELPLIASNFSGIGQKLPKQLVLLTRQLLYSESDTTFLVRIGHQYGIGEDENLSEVAEVDLSWIFPGYEIESVEERTLSGNQQYQSWTKSRLDWVGYGYDTHHQFAESPSGNKVVNISPMEIRTFHVKTKAIP